MANHTHDPLHQDENGEQGYEDEDEDEDEYEDGHEEGNEYQEEHTSDEDEDEDEEETLIPRRNQIERRMQLQKSLPANRIDSPQTSDAAYNGESFETQDMPCDELEVLDSYLGANPISSSSQTMRPMVSNGREKRRFIKTSSPPGGFAQSVHHARPRTFGRSQSSTALPTSRYNHTLLAAQQAPLSSLRSSNSFSQYRESKPGPSSVSSISTLSSTQQRNINFTRSRSINLPSFDFTRAIDAEALANRRRELRDSHFASNGWYDLYELLDFGTIPTPEQCSDAPPSQKALALIPNQKSFRKNSVIGHFFKSSKEEFQCLVLKDGVICGTTYKKTGSGYSRSVHLTQCHGDLYSALQEFRNYQSRVKGIMLPPDPEEVDVAPPRKAKFDIARDEIVNESLKKPLPHEQEAFEDTLLLHIASNGVAFDAVNSTIFRSIIEMTNPYFNIPTTMAMQDRMDRRVREMRREIKEYITYYKLYAAVTTDCWTSVDHRKFLGTTMHFFTPNFEPVSIAIGMEQVYGVQTSQNIHRKFAEAIDSMDMSERLICATTDQGANIKKAIALYQEDHKGVHWLACASHKIQLCINKSLELCEPAKKLLDKCQDISVFFRGNAAAMSILVEEQEGKGAKLLSRNITRWNSQYKMANRVLLYSQAISRTYHRMESSEKREIRLKAKELEPNLLDRDEVKALREIIHMMTDAAKFTEWVGSTDHPKLSQMYVKLKELLPDSRTYDTETAQELWRNLNRLINTMWAVDDIPDVMLISLFLNPVTLSIIKDIMTTNGDSLRKKALEVTRDAAKKFAATQDGACWDQLPLLEQEYYHSIVSVDMVYYDASISRTPMMDIARFAFTPELYWKEQKDKGLRGMDYIAPFARAYLSVQATSNDSERLFSRAGWILSARRNRMTNQNFRNIIFYHSFVSALKKLQSCSSSS